MRIQKFIDDKNAQALETAAKKEEHYFNECPVELSSILCKVLAENLIMSGHIQDQSQLPSELFKLMSLGDRKADPAIEQEIYNSYLVNTKRLIDERFIYLN